MNGEKNESAESQKRTRGVTAVSEPVSEPGKSKRRSLTAAANSPFLAGSLRNPVLSQSATQNGPRRRSGRFNDATDGGEFSSDDEYTFREVATTGVNTSQSLHNVADTSLSSVGGLHNQQGKSKQWTGTSGENYS